MKKLLLTVIIMLNFIASHGQAYVPFPIENVNWNVYLVSSCNEDPPDTVLLRYTLQGDTTINEVLYHKLCIESGESSNPDIRVIGAMREYDKKIYYRGEDILGGGTDEERVLYDFTKLVGDTIQHDSNGHFYSVVENIDSMLIDGTYRKRYMVNNHWYYHNPDYIIEGIGSIQNGLLGHISDIPTCGYHYWEHVCFRENGKVIYLNPSFEDCFSTNLVNRLDNYTMNKEIKIYPNPTMGEFIVKLNSEVEGLSLRIVDISGRTILRSELVKSGSQISFSACPGLYNVLIINGEGIVVASEKILRL